MRTLSSLLFLAWIGISAGGVGAQTPSRIATLFASDNGGGDGGAVYFDITTTQRVWITHIELNSAAALGSPVSLDVHALPNGVSHVGAESSPAWTVVSTADASVPAAGIDQPTVVPLRVPVLFEPGSRGVALVIHGGGHRYTNGDGTNQSFTDSVVTLSLGSASNAPFVAPVFSPRVWNGALRYEIANGTHPWFTADVRSGTSPLTVQFADESFSAVPGGISAIDWDIDSDGNYDYSGATAQHTYTASGVFDVTMRVVDANGGLTLRRSGFVDVDPLTAAFDAAPSGAQPYAITFTDRSTPAPSAWSWDFDDDGTPDSTQTSPTFDYPAPGIYRCALTVTRANRVATIRAAIEVQTAPMPSFISTYSFPTDSRGHWFTAPRDFSIVALEVPDEIGHGLQNAAVYRLSAAPPPPTAPATAELLFFAAGANSGRQLRVSGASFRSGEIVGVLGSTGDSTQSHSSYANSPATSSLLGLPITLSRLRAEANLVVSGGAVALSGGPGPLARVLLAVASATSFDYGVGTASGTGQPIPGLTTRDLPLIGRTARLSLDQSDLGSIGSMLIAFGRGSTPTFLGEILVDLPSLFSVAVGTAAVGSTSIDLPLPPDPALLGAGPLCFQMLLIVPGSPNSVALSNGVEWVIGQ
ncbi:MAG: PKD domain-containing protein [Planctomycetota bacterium]